MNLLNKEEMKFCKEHLKTIEQIVVTSACSNIPPTYVEGLREINKKYKFTQCVTCNSSIFLATNSLYKDYIFTKEEFKKYERERRNSNNSKNREKGSNGNDESVTEQP